ncbi:hypothetical protein ACHAPT_012994 [Fusarium lateritium]
MAPKYGFKTKGSDLVQDLSDNIKGKTVLVTGTSPGGIGALFVKAISVASPALIILTGRTTESILPTKKAIKEANPSVGTKTLAMDLNSLKSVRKAAEDVKGWADVPQIDVLVNNAGIMAPPYRTTEDGFESQFGVNHLAHFLFTNLVMDKILASGSPRIINVSSNGHRLSSIRWRDHDWEGGKVYNKWRAYGQSKTANMLFSVALAAKLASRGLQSFSLCPGAYAGSNLTRDLDFENGDDFQTMAVADSTMGTQYVFAAGIPHKDEENIISTHLLTSFSDELAGLNGRFFHNTGLADQRKDEVFSWATDPIDADRLWVLSEELVGQKFAY